MREECIISTVKNIAPRITPAHAGRMHKSALFVTVTKDHPRACGKNAQLASQAIGRAGSPPRMREESKMAEEHETITRITPAHAGRI